jgi:hypothetical protein
MLLAVRPRHGPRSSTGRPAVGAATGCAKSYRTEIPFGYRDPGLTEEWSNGPVEGFVNKLKLVKRQGYGRAGFELLRARMLAA